MEKKDKKENKQKGNLDDDIIIMDTHFKNGDIIVDTYIDYDNPDYDEEFAKQELALDKTEKRNRMYSIT